MMAQPVTGPTNVWLVRSGKHGEDEEAALAQGLAVIGFRDVPDLTPFPTVEALIGFCSGNCGRRGRHQQNGGVAREKP